MFAIERESCAAGLCRAPPIKTPLTSMDAKQRRQPLDAATLALIKIDIEESDLTLDEMCVKTTARPPTFPASRAKKAG